MDTLNELLRPTWGSEKWILEGWNRISADEKVVVQARVNELFKDGLPFQLKHDKLLYIYAFSLLAQLEVLAIQVPLQFEEKMSSPAHKQRMRRQLLDEIFHGIVFTKIVYLLCAPQAFPPAYNNEIEKLCNFIRNEECPKVAVVLLNLVSEGWIEETFASFHEQGIATKVFETILVDEHRHVSEAELYRDIGVPDKETMSSKLEALEEHLITNVLLQYKYSKAISALLGQEAVARLFESLNKKHIQQLQKINLKPGKKWRFLMGAYKRLLQKKPLFHQSAHEVEMTFMRKIFMTQWDNPRDPTMMGAFKIDISCLDFFNKKFPPQTLTLLMMQSISLALSRHELGGLYLSHQKLYRHDKISIALVVKLPDCSDQIGMVVLENCHKLTLQTMSAKITAAIRMMTHCYKSREQLENKYPHLKTRWDEVLFEHVNAFYDSPLPANRFVAVSNVGVFGYSQGTAPLFPAEAMRFILLEVERRPVWNKATQAFEPADILPISLNVDHRIIDGNVPMPALVSESFKEIFDKMLGDVSDVSDLPPEEQYTLFLMLLENSFVSIEQRHQILMFLHTFWLDLSFEELLMKARTIFNKASLMPIF